MTTINAFAQTYDETSTDFEKSSVNMQAEEDEPNLDSFEYPEDYVPDEGDISDDTEYYEEP